MEIRPDLTGNTRTSDYCSDYRVLEAGGSITGAVIFPALLRVKNHATNHRRSERNSFLYTVGTAYLHSLVFAGGGGRQLPTARDARQVCTLTL